MRIEIIGAGIFGGGLGKLWVKAGHKVLFSSRYSTQLEHLRGDGKLAAPLHVANSLESSFALWCLSHLGLRGAIGYEWRIN